MREGVLATLCNHIERPCVAKGLCGSCYQIRWRRGKCNTDPFHKAKLQKYQSRWYKKMRCDPVRLTHRRARAVVATRAWEKRHSEAAREITQRNYRRHRNRKLDSAWERSLKRLYGIDAADYAALLKKQEGKCAICKAAKNNKGKQRFDVDHDHKTGIVRGLLCSRCNRKLGFLDDNAFVVSALKYLRGEL